MTSDPVVNSALGQIGEDLVRAALSGAGDADLVVMLGSALNVFGLDVSVIEVACDAVDPERSDHFVRWCRGTIGTDGFILAADVFQGMLAEGLTMLRLGAESGRVAAIGREEATDALAFANHLAPDVTLGFFDDVMIMFVTDRPGGFSAADIDLLSRVTPTFALALGARLNADAARVLLQTYLGQDAAAAMLRGRVGLGDMERIRAIVIYCDLLGFTALTEATDARDLIDHLNIFFDAITRPVAQAGGQVAGHVGDAVVMFFPVSDAQTESSLCAKVVGAARAGLDELARLNRTPARLAAPLRARIGIDRGDVVHGNIGSAGRFSFTIIGTPVNRAARLQVLAKDLGAVMLMPADLAEAAGGTWTRFGSQQLRGLTSPVNIVGLIAMD